MRRAILFALAFSLCSGSVTAQQFAFDRMNASGSAQGVPDSVLPNKEFSARYDSIGDGRPMSVFIYPVSLGFAQQLVGPWGNNPPQAAFGGTLPTKVVPAVLDSTSRAGSRIATIPPLRIGYYILWAHAYGVDEYDLVDVSTLGLIENDAASDVGFFASDMQTHNHHSGKVTLSVWNGKARRAQRFDKSGSLVLHAPAWGSTAVAIAHSDDGSVAMMPLRERATPGTRGYIQTDRPVYRTGQTVDIRALLRDGTQGAYTIPTGARLLSVKDSAGSDVFSQTLPIDPFGALSARVKIPLDAPLGKYTIAVGSVQRTVDVLAYRKSEFELALRSQSDTFFEGDDARYTINATYLFGRPVAGLHIHYRTQFQGGIQSDAPAPQGDVVTGLDGTATITVHTPLSEATGALYLSIDAHDASGRTVSAQDTTVILPSSITVEGSATSLDGRAFTDGSMHFVINHDGFPKPTSRALTVDIVGKTYAWSGNTFLTSHIVLTVDDNGFASWKPPTPGHYEFTMSATDDQGRTAHAVATMDVVAPVAAPTVATPSPQPSVLAVHLNLPVAPIHPHDSVVARICNANAGHDVLFVYATDSSLQQTVIHARSNACFNVAIPHVDDYAVVLAEQADLGRFASDEQRITNIDPAPHSLAVNVTTDRASYAPGDIAHLSIRTLNLNGAPVRAQVGVGVVDQSIYDVEPDDSDPFHALYDSTTVPIAPSVSWDENLMWGGRQMYPMFLRTIARSTSRSQAGAFQPNATTDSYTVAGARMLSSTGNAAAPAQTIRNSFQDTAFWTATAMTDANGVASVAFPWPDNLTTWRATAVAITKDSLVGKATATALVTKQFFTRLETPRFLRLGDRSRIVGIAHGVASAPNVTLQLDAGQLSADTSERALTLGASQEADTFWPVAVPSVGTQVLTLFGSDGTRKDAMRLPLPLEADTAGEHVRSAGSLPIESSLTVSLPQGYTAGDVHIMLAPSVVAELVQSQRLLNVYPYYCTEQTTSTALPAVFINRILKRSGLASPSDLDPATIVARAVDRIKELQHPDGAWGWWEHDADHPYMTAYAMYGLAEYRKDGHPVPDDMYQRGVDALVKQLGIDNGPTLQYSGGAQPNSEWNTRAFMLFALADAAPERVDRSLLNQTAAHSADLNAYALAVLGLADHELGDDANARAVLALLDARATDAGNETYWRGDTWDHGWEGDPIESTAYALRLEVALAPHSARVEHIVNFLRAQRKGNWWYTTKDSAASVEALSEAIDTSQNEFHPDEQVRVLVDGHETASVHVTKPILALDDADVIIPAASLHDGSVVSFERTGRGSLYWSSDAVRYVPAGATKAADVDPALLVGLFAAPPKLTVSRRYIAPHDGAWRVGDEITVEVTVRSETDAQYVAVEDPFPAGVEHQPGQGGDGPTEWSGLQLLDDRAVFFADRLGPWQPLVLRYTLRVTTPGTYTAPAPSAYAMYGPPVEALGQGTTVTITP